MTVLHDTSYWIELLEEAGVPCGPINTIADVFSDPHVVERNTRISIECPAKGRIPSVASPIRLSRTPVEYRLAPPELGRDTQDVLSGLLGLGKQELDALIQRGVVSCA